MVDAAGRTSEPPPAGGNTMDWAWYPPAGRAEPRADLGEVQGHYDANKAPAQILLGVPVYAALFFGESAAQPTEEHRRPASAPLAPPGSLAPGGEDRRATVTGSTRSA